MNAQWMFFMCGTRGTLPVFGKQFAEFGGATSCYILKKNQYAIIIDCGSGLYHAGDILKDCKQIDILLTHLHYDHLIGLLGCSVLPENAIVHVYGDFPKWLDGGTLDEFFRKPFWPVVPYIGEYVTVGGMEEIQLPEQVRFKYYPGMASDEANYIRLEIGTEAIVFLFDYEHDITLPAEILEGCTILLYDGTYTNQEYADRIGWGHSYWEQGVKLAQKYGIRELIITHHLYSRTDEELYTMEREAQQYFEKVSFAKMGEQRIITVQTDAVEDKTI